MNIFFIKKTTLFLLLITLTMSCNNTPPETQKPKTPPVVENSNNTLTGEETGTGWKLLFDGKSTEQWRGYHRDSFPEKGWGIDEEGNLFVEKGGGDLITKKQFENFELKIDFKIEDTGNSGIFYRVYEARDTPIWFHAPEYQILDNDSYEDTGDGPPRQHLSGDVYDVLGQDGDFSKATGEWNTARIIILNNHVEHWLNGERIIEYKLESREWQDSVQQSKFRNFENYGKIRKGHIGLQEHGHLVLFKNIKIREM